MPPLFTVRALLAEEGVGCTAGQLQGAGVDRGGTGVALRSLGVLSAAQGLRQAAVAGEGAVDNEAGPRVDLVHHFRSPRRDDEVGTRVSDPPVTRRPPDVKVRVTSVEPSTVMPGPVIFRALTVFVCKETVELVMNPLPTN